MLRVAFRTMSSSYCATQNKLSHPLSRHYRYLIQPAWFDLEVHKSMWEKKRSQRFHKPNRQPQSLEEEFLFSPLVKK